MHSIPSSIPLHNVRKSIFDTHSTNTRKIALRTLSLLSHRNLAIPIGSTSWKIFTKEKTGGKNGKIEEQGNEEDVILESRNNKGIITLNRPKVLNALNLFMIQRIADKLKEWEGTKDFVIIKGSGNAFCAGGDVRAVVKSMSWGGHKECYRSQYTLNFVVSSLKIPYIALMDGVTMGGGVGLSIHGSHRVGTERTVFAMPEAAIGLFPDVGASYFFPRLPCGKEVGLFMALTGHRLKGSDNLRAGTVTHMCSSGKVQNLEEELVSIESDSSVLTSQIDKILQNYTNDCPVSQTTFSLEDKLAVIREIFKNNSMEKIIDELKRENSKWSSSVIETLNRMSPTSLKVTVKLLEEGSQLSLKDCLEMENRVAVRCSTADFVEGVRALIIDKDQKPKWNPSNLNDVTQTHVDSHFAPLPPNEELEL